MCDKKPYCGTRVDPCLNPMIDFININFENFRTILSCCGHDKYPKSIIIYNVKTNIVFEYYSLIFLSYGIRKDKHYYKKDSEGFYYIPEVIAHYH